MGFIYSCVLGKGTDRPCALPVNPFTTGNPFLGTKLLGFSIGRGSGALKGVNMMKRTVEVLTTNIRYVGRKGCGDVFPLSIVVPVTAAERPALVFRHAFVWCERLLSEYLALL